MVGAILSVFIIGDKVVSDVYFAIHVHVVLSRLFPLFSFWSNLKMCYRSHNVVKTFCLSVLQSYDSVFKCKLLTNTLKLHVGIRTCTLVPCYWGYTSCWNWLANPSYYYYWCGTCIIELFEFAIFANGHTKREFREFS